MKSRDCSDNGNTNQATRSISQLPTMCHEERNAISFGCGCHIRYPFDTILGIQPCIIGSEDGICDPTLNGRSRTPFINGHNRRIPIYCIAHSEARPDELDKDGRELQPTCYWSVEEFLYTEAFDHNRDIRDVKNEIIIQRMHATELLFKLTEHEGEMRYARGDAKYNMSGPYAQANGRGKATERAAVAEMGGTKMDDTPRSQLERDWAASARKKSDEEARPHKWLEDIPASETDEAKTHATLEEKLTGEKNEDEAYKNLEESRMEVTKELRRDPSPTGGAAYSSSAGKAPESVRSDQRERNQTLSPKSPLHLLKPHTIHPREEHSPLAKTEHGHLKALPTSALSGLEGMEDKLERCNEDERADSVVGAQRSPHSDDDEKMEGVNLYE